MALTTTTRKVIHDGNASATVFPYSFPILEASHLSVIYTDADDVETTLSASQYSVTGIGGRTGGNVTYPLTGSPIATGTKLTIVRTVPYTQTTVLSNQGGYYPEVVERRFDEIYMAIQQLAEIVGRTSTFSISDPATEQSNYALIQALQSDIGGLDKLTTQGDLLTRDASDYKRLARGTAGQFLGISGANPVWAVPQVNLASGDVSGVLPRSKGGFTPAQTYLALGTPVSMVAATTWYTGPSISLGTGTWLVFGRIGVGSSGGGDNIDARLWDGTNELSTGRFVTNSVGAGYLGAASIFCIAVDPAASVRMQAQAGSRTDNVIAAESAIMAFRIA